MLETTDLRSPHSDSALDFEFTQPVSGQVSKLKGVSIAEILERRPAIHTKLTEMGIIIYLVVTFIAAAVLQTLAHI